MRIPFNIKKALTGDFKVVTGFGETVTDLTHFTNADEFPVVGVVEGEVRTWTEYGQNDPVFNTDESEDLFLEVAVQDAFVNLYWNAEERRIMIGLVYRDPKYCSLEEHNGGYTDLVKIKTLDLKKELPDDFLSK